jgi:hypothetical protein
MPLPLELPLLLLLLLLLPCHLHTAQLPPTRTPLSALCRRETHRLLLDLDLHRDLPLGVFLFCFSWAGGRPAVPHLQQCPNNAPRLPALCPT